MLDTRNLLSGKPMYLFGGLLLVFIASSSVAFIIAGSDDFDLARREVLLRRIGHEILLQSGDDTSRVLPVKKIAENEYQLSFEQAFTFQPDLLVNTTQRLLAKDPLAHDYVVNVLNCADASVAYGYAVSKNKKDDIVTCRGRKQPLGCYLLNIKFKPRGVILAKEGYFLGALLFLAFVGFTFLGSGKPRRPLPGSQDTGMFTLGSILFDAATRKLMMNGMTIDLTATETRVLRIFASSPNVTVERSRLQKEIWEDEGVIVGRSLDVFISKLRKKLELDSRIKIVVVRGKGYRLEMK